MGVLDVMVCCLVYCLSAPNKDKFLYLLETDIGNKDILHRLVQSTGLHFMLDPRHKSHKECPTHSQSQREHQMIYIYNKGLFLYSSTYDIQLHLFSIKYSFLSFFGIVFINMPLCLCIL